jgi:hypothetical protein
MHGRCVYHVLPEGEESWDYGETLFAGADMTERREVLGRLSALFVIVEGGPGVGHEAEVASSQGAVVLPVGRSGGHAATLYLQISRPPVIDRCAILAKSIHRNPLKFAVAFRCLIPAVFEPRSLHEPARTRQKKTAIAQKIESAARMPMRVSVPIRPTTRMRSANMTNGMEKIAMIEASQNRAPHSFMLPASPFDAP